MFCFHSEWEAELFATTAKETCVCVSLVGRLWRRESDTVETHFSACHTSLRANYPPDTQAEKVCEAALSKREFFEGQENQPWSCY